MTTEETKSLEPWKPQDFTDKVEKKIREVFVDLIPEEVFHQMVSDALNAFTTGATVTVGGRYHNDPKREQYNPSGLERLVESLLKSEVENRIRELLRSDDWTVRFDNTIGEKLKELVKETAPLMIESMLSSMVSAVINNMQNSRVY